MSGVALCYDRNNRIVPPVVAPLQFTASATQTEWLTGTQRENNQDIEKMILNLPCSIPEYFL